MRKSYHRPHPSPVHPHGGAAAGFSLAELLVTLFIMAIVVVGVLTFFDMSNRLSRTQVNISEMQSAQRIAQQELVDMLSEAGIGGLPEGVERTIAVNEGVGPNLVFPRGLALSVDNNVASGTDVGDGGEPMIVVEGTDILTLRGVFSTPVYYIEPQLAVAPNPGSGQFTVTLDFDVDAGVTQSLDPLRDALAAGNPEAIIVYDRFNPGHFAVFEYVPGISALGPAGSNTMTVGLSIDTGTTYATNQYRVLTLGTTLLPNSGGVEWPPVADSTQEVQLPRNIGALGLLEEYRFFIREQLEVPSLPTSRLTPALTRARYYPGTTVLHPDRDLVVADNVIDLQIALGVDQTATDGLITEIGLAADDDEVLYNFPGDNDFLGAIAASPWAVGGAALHFVRVTTVIQSDRPDRDFPGVILETIEDHQYDALPVSIFNTGNYTAFRKRLLQTTVEPRNLP